MAVKIKLKRLGRVRVPHYRIVVADARTRRDGRAIEEIGKYHPKDEPSLIEVNSERALHWLSVGAQPTPPVMNILKITGDWQKFKGEPGAEGTLRTAGPRDDKKERFAAALADTQDESGSSAGKGGRARKSGQSGQAQGARDGKQESGRSAKAGGRNAPAADAAAETAQSATEQAGAAGAQSGDAASGEAASGVAAPEAGSAERAAGESESGDQ